MKSRLTLMLAAWLATPLATWFGCGLSPWAPGTAGSMGALAVAHLLGWHHRNELLLAAAVMLLPAVWSATAAAGARGGHKDPGFVVIDEVLGQWIALAGAARYTFAAVVLAFALFRVFDIWKPYPLKNLERLPAGWGIVADDLGAGVYAALVLCAAGWLNLY